MKTVLKAIFIGVISFFVCLYGNYMFAGTVEAMIPGGDPLLNSYFRPLYTAVTLLISLVISCSYLIVQKINLLLEKIEEAKNPD